MKRPAFQFYPGDWLSSMDITVMTIAEEGAYHRLLCHAWSQDDCGLPDDDSKLAILSKLGAEWHTSSAVIRAKFEVRDGRLYNERLLKERAKQEEWARKSAEGGKLSATKRQPKPNQKATTLQPPFNHPCDLVDTKPQPTGQPKGNSLSSSLSLSSEEPKTISPPEVSQLTLVSPPIRVVVREEPPEFADFWEQRWRSDDRAAAVKAFRKVATSPGKVRQIMDAVKAQRPAMMTREKDVRPYMSTWLNKERFADEPESRFMATTSPEPPQQQPMPFKDRYEREKDEVLRIAERIQAQKESCKL